MGSIYLELVFAVLNAFEIRDKSDEIALQKKLRSICSQKIINMLKHKSET